MPKMLRVSAFIIGLFNVWCALSMKSWFSIINLGMGLFLLWVSLFMDNKKRLKK